MKDCQLAIIALVAAHPRKPLKFYQGLSGCSRGSFFKAKKNLEQLGMLRVTDRKLYELDMSSARTLIEAEYPGTAALFTKSEPAELAAEQSVPIAQTT